jgi:type I restriction enzyme S subunit
MSFDLTTIGEYAVVQGGFAYKSQDFISEPGIAVLKIKNVRQGFVDYASPSYVSDETASATSKWFTVPGDVLISMTGSGPSAPESLVGRVARVWKQEPRALINQRVGRLRLKDGSNIDSDFLFYLLSQRDVQE